MDVNIRFCGAKNFTIKVGSILYFVRIKKYYFNRFKISKNGLKHVNMFNLFSLSFLVDLNNLLPAV